MNNIYFEPEFKVVKAKTDDVITTSGGWDFNMSGDQPFKSFYKNSNWTLEL